MERKSEQMHKRFVLFFVLFGFGMAAEGIAQTPPAQTANESNQTSVDILPLLAQLNAAAGMTAIPSIADLSMNVPDEPDAWLVRIVSGGGFTGKYQGFVVASQGTVRCTQETPCRGTLSASELESVKTLLSEPVLSKWPQTTASLGSPVSVCSDCIRVWMELRHREKDGTEKLYSATWDSVSKASLPVEVRQIYETAMALRR